jgi:hypothetical protein
VSVALPESIDPEEEIAILWETEGDILKVTASLGDASILVESEIGSDASFVLVQGLPAIMQSVYEAANEEEK